jgi:hypothetical protein
MVINSVSLFIILCGTLWFKNRLSNNILIFPLKRNLFLKISLSYRFKNIILIFYQVYKTIRMLTCC